MEGKESNLNNDLLSNLTNVQVIKSEGNISKSGEEKNTVNEWKPDTLVIGSGGARGYLYLGALHRLYANGYLENVKTFVGVSVGSILVFLIASGMTPRHIWSDFKFIQSKDLVSLSNNILKNFGLFKMDKIESYLQTLIEPIFGKSPTFQEFFDKTGNDLHIITSNITQRKKVVFCKSTHPNVEVIKTLCMSSSIPLVFEPYMYNNCEYNDGANYTTYPINEINDNKRQILGLYIDDVNEDDSIMNKMNMILTGSWDGKRNEAIKQSGNNVKHICIYSNFSDITGVTLDIDKKIKLLSAGDTSAQLWIQDQERCVTENPSYMFLRTVVDYCEMNNTSNQHYEESDEEHSDEEVNPVTKEAFYEDATYNESYLI